jgi:hypothetical protein
MTRVVGKVAAGGGAGEHRGRGGARAVDAAATEHRRGEEASAAAVAPEGAEGRPPQ